MMVTAAVVSLLAGATNVLNRTFNARLAEATSTFVATLANFVTGLFTACLVLAAVWHNLPPLPVVIPPWWVFLGGAFGVTVVSLLSIATVKISALYLSLLTFVGQVLAGVIIDAVLTGAFAWQNLVGALLVSAGMVMNLMIEHGEQREAAKAKAEAETHAKD